MSRFSEMRGPSLCVLTLKEDLSMCTQERSSEIKWERPNFGPPILVLSLRSPEVCLHPLISVSEPPSSHL